MCIPRFFCPYSDACRTRPKALKAKAFGLVQVQGFWAISAQNPCTSCGGRSMPPQEDALRQWLNSSHKRRFRCIWEELCGCAVRISRFAVCSADIRLPHQPGENHYKSLKIFGTFLRRARKRAGRGSGPACPRSGQGADKSGRSTAFLSVHGLSISIGKDKKSTPCGVVLPST